MWSNGTISFPRKTLRALVGRIFTLTPIPVSRILLPVAAETYGWRCLSFHRHMYGYHVGALQVFKREIASGLDTILWTTRGDGANDWYHEQVPLMLQPGFEVDCVTLLQTKFHNVSSHPSGMQHGGWLEILWTIYQYASDLKLVVIVPEDFLMVLRYQ